MYVCVNKLSEAVGGIEQAIDLIRVSQVLVGTWASSNADRYREMLNLVEAEAVTLRREIEEHAWGVRRLLAEAEA